MGVYSSHSSACCCVGQGKPEQQRLAINGASRHEALTGLGQKREAASRPTGQ